MQVAIPYSSRVAFGQALSLSELVELPLLPSPIHHGLHSDYVHRGFGEPYFHVAIPYSSRVAFGPAMNTTRREDLSCCHPLFITGCIRTRGL